MKTRNRWLWNERWWTVSTQTGRNLYKLNRLWLHWKYSCCSTEKREFRGATDVSWAEVQNRDARKAPPTDVPTLAAATGCTCRFLWTPPTHLLPFRKLIRLQNEEWGGNLLCTSRNPEKTLTEHSKMLVLESVSRGLGKQVPEGLSAQFPDHRPCTSRACLN